MTIVVQVNGKVRSVITLPSDADEATVIAAARANEKVASYVTGDPKKTIYIPQKLVSFVI
jgi:leucyl-tRNA synthetase